MWLRGVGPLKTKKIQYSMKKKQDIGYRELHVHRHRQASRHRKYLNHKTEILLLYFVYLKSHLGPQPGF